MVSDSLVAVSRGLLLLRTYWTFITHESEFAPWLTGIGKLLRSLLTNLLVRFALLRRCVGGRFSTAALLRPHLGLVQPCPDRWVAFPQVGLPICLLILGQVLVVLPELVPCSLVHVTCVEPLLRTSVVTAGGHSLLRVLEVCAERSSRASLIYRHLLSSLCRRRSLLPGHLESGLRLW